MKKKLFTFMLSVCAVFSLAIFSMNLSPKTNASAFTKSASTYTISGTNAALSIKDGSDTEISAGKTTLSDALAYIVSTANVEATEPIEVLFDSVVLDSPEQITLSQSFVFSGNLEINNSSTFFAIENNQAELSFVFDTFNITNKTDTFNDFNFISVEGTKKTNITLFNSNFNLENTSSETSHLVNFISSNNSLLLKGEVTTDTTLLCNWKSGISITTYQNADEPENPIDNFFTDDEGNELTTNTESFSISVPYDTKEASVVKNVETFNIKRFNIVQTKDFFTVSTQIANDNIVATSNMTFVFDLNGGTYNETPEPNTFTFVSTNKIDYPTASDITLENHSFGGWFGVINIDETDYYFDQTVLSSLLSDPNTTLPTSLDDFQIDTSFSAFNYFSKNDGNKLAEYSAVHFLAEQGLAPKFIAKWNIDTFDITFDSNGGSIITESTSTYDFGSKITPPANPTLVGHTFAGWFTEPEKNSGTEINFNTYEVFKNETFYAQWDKNTYTISFVTNSDTIISIPSISYEYGETIMPLEQLSENGRTFVGWFEFDGNTVSDTEFETGVAMPANNIILHAIWKIQRCTVNFNANGGSHISMYEVDYGTLITPPENPKRNGYIFSGWYHNQTCTEDKLVIFTNDGKYEIKKSETFYAKWIQRQYLFSVNKNNGSEITETLIGFDQNIIIPEDPTLANYIFAGWFTDEDLTQKLNPNQTMPAKDFTIYAKWTEKPRPIFDTNKQIYTTKNYNSEFVNKGNLKGFLIKYYVNNEWVLTPPTEVGTYDIMISRNEDEIYASYHQIIEDAFVIEPVQKNLAWIIIALFIVAAFEFAVAIFVKIMRKMKFNMVVSIAIPLGSTFISSSQVVLLAISGIAAVAGLITMIYQLVKLHRTVPVALFETNTENNTQEQIMNHSNKVIEEVQTYSESDIEEMLKHDSVGAAIREKHKLDEKDFSEFEKEKQPIAPVETVEDDDDDDGDLKAVVEIIEDEYIPNANDIEKLYNSDDPFIRKDPNDYSNSNKDNEF